MKPWNAGIVGNVGNVWSYEIVWMSGIGDDPVHLKLVLVVSVYYCTWLEYFVWDYKSDGIISVTIQRMMCRDYVYD